MTCLANAGSLRISFLVAEPSVPAVAVAEDFVSEVLKMRTIYENMSWRLNALVRAKATERVVGSPY